jgi:transposase-like protein
MPRLFEFEQKNKQEHPIRCPHCATTLICRYGTYLRAHPEQPIQVPVQRYLCKSPYCRWRTFSLLPYPFLPIIRHFYQALLYCHHLYNVKKESQASTGRRLGKERGVIKRLGGFCRRFIPWIEQEKVFTEWGPDPTANHGVFWPDFVWDVSQAFYPNRWPAP